MGNSTITSGNFLHMDLRCPAYGPDQWISCFGKPHRVITDREKHFRSELFHNISINYHFKLNQTTVHFIHNAMGK